jgi:hypothetical protein
MDSDEGAGYGTQDEKSNSRQKERNTNRHLPLPSRRKIRCKPACRGRTNQKNTKEYPVHFYPPLKQLWISN